MLVSTGYSFPDLLTWFAPYRRPVVLAEERAYNGFKEETEGTKYVVMCYVMC